MAIGSKEIILVGATEAMAIGTKEIMAEGAKETMSVGAREIMAIADEEIMVIRANEFTVTGYREITAIGAREATAIEGATENPTTSTMRAMSDTDNTNKTTTIRTSVGGKRMGTNTMTEVALWAESTSLTNRG